MEFEAFECYDAFKNQCTNDKMYVKDIYKRFRTQVLECGRHILERYVCWSYVLSTKSMTSEEIAHIREFLEFIDNNGFIVDQVETDRIRITPIYPEYDAPLPF